MPTCEVVGYDRYLKTNTVKKTTHSLFRQGCMVYDLLPNMPGRWPMPIMQSLAQSIQEQALCQGIYGVD